VSAASEVSASVSGFEVADLRLVNLVKSFSDFTAVDDLTLTIPAGSFFALLGPSGCGKTTTLRMVAGLEDPTSGKILLGEQDLTAMKAYKRPVNTVFQSYALFPHLDVFENVAFGLRRRGIKNVAEQVNAMLDLVELGPLARRKPAQLSGGQQQRVAVARALINHPGVLLLDEPLGALDLKLRRQMQLELKRIQTDVGTSFVHVTHDQEEAMTMADTVAVMNKGRIEQMGPPEEIYDLPRTKFVATFLGQSNEVAGEITGTDGESFIVSAYGVSFALPRHRSVPTQGELLLGVRPEKLTIVPVQEQDSVPDKHSRIRGKVVDVAFMGVSTQYVITTSWGDDWNVFEQNRGSGVHLHEGDEVIVHWAPEHSFGLERPEGA
jgi:spermidine/putrescine transport system ATP-binding protein